MCILHLSNPVDYPFNDEEEESSEEEEGEPLALADSALLTAATPLLPPTSPLTPLSSPLPKISSPPLLLPFAHRVTIPEAEMPPRKRICFTTPSCRFEVGESSKAAAAIQPAQGTDVVVLTALEEVKERVTDLVTTHRQDNEEFYTRHQDTQDNRSVLRARISTLERERRYHHSLVIAAEHEAIYARQAWTYAMDRIQDYA
ncbi:hypothetical protein Tco_1468106 [Tanacetum coccineum]